MKKVISLFLSLTMLLSIVSVVDFSAYADVQTGKLGDNVTYSLDTETGLLTISGTGDMYDYKLSFHDYNGREYYSSTPLKMENIKNIIIESGVTDIGDAVFFNCKIQSITIPDTVTRIGNYAFIGFKKSEITLPNSVISIAYSAFNISVEGNISYLKKINYNGTVTQWNSVVYSNKDHHIIKCTDGIIGNGNTVTIDNFSCNINNDYTAQIVGRTDTLGNLIIPEPVWYEGHTFTVTSIVNNAFSGCSSLTSVTIPNSVESIGDNAFQNCSSLTSATIGNNVTSIGSSAFFGCSKLKKIEIPDSVTYIGSKAFDGTAFYNTVKNWEDGVLYCGNHLISAKSDVTKITVKASTVSIAAGALDNCKSLKKINVLNPKCVINCTIPKTAVILFSLQIFAPLLTVVCLGFGSMPASS